MIMDPSKNPSESSNQFSLHGLSAAGKLKAVSILSLATHVPKHRALQSLYPELGFDLKCRSISCPNLTLTFALAFSLREATRIIAHAEIKSILGLFGSIME
jgi:hypothetical protein